MANFPRFASPVPQEWRVYYRAVRQWFQNGSERPERPENRLQPFRDAKEKRRKKLISFRLDEDLLEFTKKLARSSGIRSSSGNWIQDGLRRSIQEGTEDPEQCPFLFKASRGFRDEGRE